MWSDGVLLVKISNSNWTVLEELAFDGVLFVVVFLVEVTWLKVVRSDGVMLLEVIAAVLTLPLYFTAVLELLLVWSLDGLDDQNCVDDEALPWRMELMLSIAE